MTKRKATKAVRKVTLADLPQALDALDLAGRVASHTARVVGDRIEIHVTGYPHPFYWPPEEEEGGKEK
jgi:hypothetical protein